MPQKIIFPMQYLRITTGINELSHKGSNAIDVAGKDTGIDNAFAPFTGTIKRIYALGNTVWLESNAPVEFADGTVDYATVSFTHDSIVSDLSVGQVVQQGQIFYQEGTANASGAHIHLEVGRGKFTGKGWFKNAQGNWVINGSYEPWRAFWLTVDTIILNGYNYPWKLEEEMKPDTAAVTNQFKAFGSGEPSAKQITYYTARPWNVLNEDLLVWNRDKRVELEKQLSAKPKEVVVQKLVEVPLTVYVDKPVEVIKEVVKGDDERSLGDLLSAAFKKLFKVI